MPLRALILCIAAGTACAQEAKFCTIEGTVTDARSGAPISGATLLLSSRAGGQPRVFNYASGATGKFSLTYLTPDNYQLTATAEGHSQSTVAFNCTGAMKSVTIALPWQGVI